MASSLAACSRVRRGGFLGSRTYSTIVPVLLRIRSPGGDDPGDRAAARVSHTVEFPADSSDRLPAPLAVFVSRDIHVDVFCIVEDPQSKLETDTVLGAVA